MNDTIPLSEKIYLLAIHPEKGGIVSASYTAMDYILPGTLFMELYQKGHIRFDDKRIILVNQNSKNEIHRFLLNKFGQAKKPLKISRWINKLYFSQKYIRRSVQQGLVNKRIIKMEKKSFLIFKWRKPVIINKPFVFSLRNEIENKVFGGANGIAALGDGYFGLFSGDFDHNGQVQNTDYARMIITLGTAGYLQGDMDLNGQVQNIDLQKKLIPNIGKGGAF